MKKYLYVNSILILLFVVLTTTNNCSRNFDVYLTNLSQVSISKNSGGGNGYGYDGKLTFVNTIFGFKCENHPAPKSIIRRSETGIWNMTINEVEHCASLDRKILSDVNYVKNQTFLVYEGVRYTLDQTMPEEPSSLLDFVGYFKVSDIADPNSVDANPGDGVCADVSGECSLMAAAEEARLETKKVLLIRVPIGTFSINQTLSLGNDTFEALPAEKPIVRLEGEDSSKTIIDANHTTSVAKVFQRTVEFENLSLINGFNNAAFGSSAITTAPSSNLFIKNCFFTGHTAGAGALIDLEPGSGNIWIENSRFKNNTANAILSVFSAMSLTLKNSDISDNSGYGVDVNNGSRNIQIFGSNISNDLFGIRLRKCYFNCRIENTSVTNNQRDGLSLIFDEAQSEDIHVVNSVISGNSIQSGANISFFTSLAIPYSASFETTSVTLPAPGRPNCLWMSLVTVPVRAMNSSSDDNSCGF